MYNLNWTQAQEAMREGKRVRNSNFTVAEWFAFDGLHIVDEEGYYMDKWYQGYEWQDEGWMVIEDETIPYEWKEEEIRLTEAERQEMKAVILCDDFSALEKKIVALYAGHCCNLEMNYSANILIPQAYPRPREKQNYNLRIHKGRGHNKLQKRKKK